MNEELLIGAECADLDHSQEPLVELTESALDGYETLCRLCANRNDTLIPVYSEEGISNELAKKINLYLPVKVLETDTLPLQCCFQCASTVLTWHELVVASVMADRRLRDLQSHIEKELLLQGCGAGPSQPDQPGVCSDDECGDSGADNDDDDDDDNDDNDDSRPTTLSRPPSLSQARREQPGPAPARRRGRPAKKRGQPAAAQPAWAGVPSDSDADADTTAEAGGGADAEAEVGPESDTGRGKREYQCQHCTASAAGRDAMRRHVEAQHPDKYTVFLEKRHKRRSKIDQEAVERAKMVVDARTYYHCSVCGKNLHSPYTYIWHRRIHTGERPFMCDLCGKQFRVSQGLVRHLRETHAGIKNFACDLCGRMFATRRNVEEHRRIHTNERPYICNLCGKAFKQKASLFVHNRSHTDSFPFKCSYCDQGFRTKPPLLVHVTRHTGEKPFACDVCGRCFRIKYELKRHRLIHSDDKPFSCADCGLSFRQKRYLRNHNKINHNRPTP